LQYTHTLRKTPWDTEDITRLEVVSTPWIFWWLTDGYSHFQTSLPAIHNLKTQNHTE
ncbi:unnamed protein product, partial [Allacma fusca]